MRRKNPANYSPRVTFSIEEEELENILEWNCFDMIGLDFVGRQLRTPAGIIDVLARHPGRKNIYFVIELKKGDVDAAAYCQAHRYCTYLNSELSKDGKRVFIPMVIGKNVHDEIRKCVHYYSDHFRHPYRSSHLIGKTFYSLYEMHAVNGISFKYYNSVQKEYEDANLSSGEPTYYERSSADLMEQIEEVEGELGCAHLLIEKLQEQIDAAKRVDEPKLAVVK